ncbi:MAG: ABC transporter ATP-binding protein [Streptococcaceae bacterium]|nr:ABC transporter ATP-binding protein [Streptococcaceae bacterium]MCL2681688.1 ABC transporter ATP-binding protein [Streptococcaceae bacterium]
MKISIENLNKDFVQQEVLKNLSATFYNQEINVIIGESGSGKSTLLNILALFENPDNGKVFYDDKEVTALSNKNKQTFIREKIGYIYQDIRVFDELTVYENIKLALQFSAVPKKDYKEKIKSVLKILNMSDNADKSCSVLSGGEKQRVAIGRTIACEKEILFADEPTGSLDSNNTQVIIDLLKEINANFKTTVIMITHSEQVSNQFEHQYLLKQGQLYEKNN